LLRLYFVFDGMNAKKSLWKLHFRRKRKLFSPSSSELLERGYVWVRFEIKLGAPFSVQMNFRFWKWLFRIFYKPIWWNGLFQVPTCPTMGVIHNTNPALQQSGQLDNGAFGTVWRRFIKNKICELKYRNLKTRMGQIKLQYCLKKWELIVSNIDLKKLKCYV
jgi:hypothetical protein